MAYIEPKTNWNEEYEPAPEDMNRIEGNIKELKDVDVTRIDGDISDIEARSILAGDGLSGGGTLAGSRTITVDGSVARIEDSTSATITDYAVGSILAVNCDSRTYDMNSTTTLYAPTGPADRYTILDYPLFGFSALSGTWRARGLAGTDPSLRNYFLFQRVS